MAVARVGVIVAMVVARAVVVVVVVVVIGRARRWRVSEASQEMNERLCTCNWPWQAQP